MSHRLKALPSLLLVTLAACGGGGSGTSTIPAGTNVAFTATPAAQQQIAAGQVITLSATLNSYKGLLANMSWTATAMDPAALADVQNWDIQEWNYRWSERYGSDLYSVAEPGRVVAKKGALKGDVVGVKTVEIADEGRRVRLQVPGIRPAMQWMLRGTLKTAMGEAWRSLVRETVRSSRTARRGKSNRRSQGRDPSRMATPCRRRGAGRCSARHRRGDAGSRRR